MTVDKSYLCNAKKKNALISDNTFSQHGYLDASRVVNINPAKVACLVYGDKNIIWKGLAALLSFKNKNPNFDYYLATDPDAITQESLNYAKMYNINIFSHPKEIYDYILKFEKTFSRFPKIVHARFAYPLVFHRLGYEKLILIEYDMICMKRFDLDIIYPFDTPWACRTIKTYESLPNEHIKWLCENLNISDNDIKESAIPNAGFIVYNTTEYVASGIMDIFPHIFNIINHLNTTHVPDEIAMGLLRCKYGIKHKLLSYEYNAPAAVKILDEEIINLHFIAIKPWDIYSMIENNIINSELKYKWFTFIINSLEYIKFVSKLPFHKYILDRGSNIYAIYKTIQSLENEYSCALRDAKASLS